MDLKTLIIFALFCQTFASNVMPPIPKKADVNKLVYSLNPNSEVDFTIYDEMVKNPTRKHGSCDQRFATNNKELYNQTYD